MLPPKVCPSCGEEFIHTILVCPDCNVSLGADAPAPEPAFELPPTEQLVALRNAEVSWIEGLAEALATDGIPSRVELPRREDNTVQGRGMGAIRCTIFVRREDGVEATRIDAAYARTQVPDLPHEGAGEWGESDACPGCGAVLASDASECPECGLSFAPPGE